MLAIIFAILLILGISFILYHANGIQRYHNNSQYTYTNRDSYECSGWILTIVSAFVLLILMGISISNITVAADLEARYTSNISNYQTISTQAKNLISEDYQVNDPSLIPITGSIEKYQISQQVINLMTDLRNNVNQYNSDLAGFKALKNNIWVGFMYPAVPKNLEFITLDATIK